MIYRVCLTLCFFSFIAKGAFAQPMIDRALACVQIKTDSERLKCFDTSMVPEQTGKKNIGNWHVDVNESRMDKSKTVTVSLSSSESNIASRSFGNKNDQALLIIRCAEKKTELYFNFDYLVSLGSRSGIDIQYRIGKSAPKKVRWSRSQNGKGFGPWDGPTTVPIIRQMIDSEDFFIRSESELSGTTETLFKLDGLSEAIKPVQEACKWPKIT